MVYATKPNKIPICSSALWQLFQPERQQALPGPPQQLQSFLERVGGSSAEHPLTGDAVPLVIRGLFHSSPGSGESARLESFLLVVSSRHGCCPSSPVTAPHPAACCCCRARRLGLQADGSGSVLTSDVVHRKGCLKGYCLDCGVKHVTFRKT